MGSKRLAHFLEFASCFLRYAFRTLFLIVVMVHGVVVFFRHFYLIGCSGIKDNNLLCKLNIILPISSIY
jgi:hypothetical protein